MGFGLTSSDSPELGMRQAMALLSLEGLVTFRADGRPEPLLAEGWRLSTDGRELHIALRGNDVFHDGEPVTTALVRDLLVARLPGYLGPVFEDVERIEAVSPTELVVTLKRRSSFVLDGLDLPVTGSATPPNGTGPFYTSGPAEMRANRHYSSGKPLIDRIVFEPYASVRAAWADLLRGQVDALYEVGLDGLESLTPSTETNVFTFQRPYAYLVMLNLRNPLFKSSATRRVLNRAIDRQALIAEGLGGYGLPADGPVSPGHWAYSKELPKFQYAPVGMQSGEPRFTCVFADSSLERLALVVQKQLQAVGVRMDLELLPLDQAMERVQAGEFDAFLSDFSHGFSLIRPHFFWHSRGLYNWGHYRSATVDAAFDQVRFAADDETYRKGVAALQRAIVDDPPAIFLAWSQRARAVSTRFELPADPSRLGTLHLWRPAAVLPVPIN